MQVQATTRQSYRQAARLLALAFLDEPVSQRIYRQLTRDQILRNLTLDFTGEMRICLRVGEPLEVRQDRVLAAAMIYPPGAYPLGRLDELFIQAATVIGHTRYDFRAWQTWLKEAGRLHPDAPHYYLEYIGVEPTHQGQGLGSMLLTELTRSADAAKVGCYLETATERNVLLYQRFGFQIIAQKEIIGLPAWFMWRPPTTPPCRG